MTHVEVKKPQNVGAAADQVMAEVDSCVFYITLQVTSK
jgi:hypothetical protein